MTAILLPPRPFLIQRLLWASLGVGCVTIALSLVLLGWISLFISPAAFLFSAIFDITLLILSAKERKSAALEPAMAPATASPNTKPPTSAPTPDLPSTCRSATISAAIFVVIAWLAAFITSICLVAVSDDQTTWGTVSESDSRKRFPVAYVEIVSIAFQIGILVWLIVLCVKERKSLSILQDKQGPTLIPSIITPQQRWILRLVGLALLFAATILGVSMANLGKTSLFLSPTSAGVTFIYTITLLAKTFVERKRQHTPRSATDPSPATTDGPAASYPPAQHRTPFHGLPCTSRKPAIIFGFLLAVLWMATLGMAVSFTVLGATDSDFGEGHDNTAAAGVECGFVGLEIGVVITLATLCTKERRRLLGQAQKLKWWQLGVYKA
ncbi:hypothetical protein DFP72DRAFT_532829 [Ephemerocybe angulata]|uniref:Uncharacterized protein n=1 Tax=Ephemerocybe angulata TaxID=980116 RepID=A0A8H6HPD3_9AGAR|nr:hypothetical protein DFP72DRAFT_532829 [Tulosesus angulatus]